MSILTPITLKLYHGIVLKTIDPKNQGRYQIHIPVLHQHIDTSKGIWCKNHVHVYRNTNEHKVDPGVPLIEAKNKQDPFSNPSNYGQYLPLQENTEVLISFFKNDYSTGEIVKIISDESFDNLPLKNTTEDRDEFYQLIRTARFTNINIINEETVTQPRNSIHWYFNKNRTKVILNEDGIHVYTDDNEYITITKDLNIHIKGNKRLEIEQDYDQVVQGDVRSQTLGETHIRNEEVTKILVGTDEASADLHIKIKGNVFIQTEADTNIVTEGDTFITTLGETHIKSEEELRIETLTDLNIKAGNDIIIDAGGTFSVVSAGNTRIDAANIHLNKDGNSIPGVSAIDASTNEEADTSSTNPGYDTTDPTTKELKNLG